jgi:hypothetical protein
LNKISGPRGARSRLSLALSAFAVMGSVLGAWFVIDSNKTTDVFLVTKQDMPSGAALTPASLEQIELSLFELTEAYLQPDLLPEGAYLERPIGSGEAIPLSAITNQNQDNWSNIVITPEVPISSQIAIGSKVAIWAAPLIEFQSFGEPALLAVDAEVVAVIEPEGGFSGQSRAVELRVPNASIQYLLGAITNKASIALTATARSS